MVYNDISKNIKSISNSWKKSFFLILIFISILFIGNAQMSESDSRINNSINRRFIENNIECLVFDVVFFNYRENVMHLNIIDMPHQWLDAVQMRIVSGKYENRVFNIVSGEYPVRSQFKNAEVIRIKIDKNDFERVINSSNNNLINKGTSKN
ncbi:MAG: hypothetical protein FWD47_10050 [Treponema sp.]|nr:hypothetical protein [Treponema sp.]